MVLLNDSDAVFHNLIDCLYNAVWRQAAILDRQRRVGLDGRLEHFCQLSQRVERLIERPDTPGRGRLEDLRDARDRLERGEQRQTVAGVD